MALAAVEVGGSASNPCMRCTVEERLPLARDVSVIMSGAQAAYDFLVERPGTNATPQGRPGVGEVSQLAERRA